MYLVKILVGSRPLSFPQTEAGKVLGGSRPLPPGPPHGPPMPATSNHIVPWRIWAGTITSSTSASDYVKQQHSADRPRECRRRWYSFQIKYFLNGKFLHEFVENK